MTRHLPLIVAPFLLLTVAGCAVASKIRPGDGTEPQGDRVMLAAQARGEAREREASGAWANPGAIRNSDFREQFPQNCTESGSGIACTDQTPVRAGSEGDPAWQGRVAIAFSEMGDGSRCFGEARQGTMRGGVMSGNIVAVRSYPGANGRVPRPTIQTVVAGSGDHVSWDDIASPQAFLGLCNRMGPTIRRAG